MWYDEPYYDEEWPHRVVSTVACCHSVKFVHAWRSGFPIATTAVQRNMLSTHALRVEHSKSFSFLLESQNLQTKDKTFQRFRNDWMFWWLVDIRWRKQLCIWVFFYCQRSKGCPPGHIVENSFIVFEWAIYPLSQVELRLVAKLQQRSLHILQEQSCDRRSPTVKLSTVIADHCAFSMTA